MARRWTEEEDEFCRRWAETGEGWEERMAASLRMCHRSRRSIVQRARLLGVATSGNLREKVRRAKDDERERGVIVPWLWIRQRDRLRPGQASLARQRRRAMQR